MSAPKPITKQITKQIWLIWASCISTIIIGTYIVLHVFMHSDGKKVQLSATQLSSVSTIIATVKDSSAQSQKEVKRLIVHYIEDVLDMSDRNAVDEMVKSYNLQNLQAVLPNYQFTVNSYFWLTGPWVLLEVLFWSIFGLIANLMYKVTIADQFDPTRIPEHIGKLFYTPIASLVVFLALSALVNSGSVALDDGSEHVVVLSFILGFFTERTIILIGKIKDLILPAGNDGRGQAPEAISPEAIVKQVIQENEASLNTQFPGLILSLSVGTMPDQNLGVIAELSAEAPSDFPTGLNVEVAGQLRTVPIETKVKEQGANPAGEQG